MTVDERFDRIEKAIAETNQRIADTNQRLDQAVAGLAQSIERLTQYVLDFRQETATRFQLLDNRLDIINANIASIEARFQPFANALLEFGAVSTKLADAQWKQKDIVAELVERVAKLEKINPAA